MATTVESQVANAAGVVHSIPRESFAAANSIFTKPADCGLSNTQHDDQFLSLDGRAITPSRHGASLAQQFSCSQVVLVRLVRHLTAPVLTVDDSS